MTDTCCQRHGYDNTGRYHVPGPGPEPEKCPHCDGTHKPWVTCEEVTPEPKFPATGNMDHPVNMEAVSQTGNTTAPVNIPLEVQERLFNAYRDSVVYELKCLLESFDWTQGIGYEDEETGTRNELHDLALSRLRSGYEQYGSEMFTWDAETRRRNVMEELADAIVYLCSGPVE